MTEQIHKKRSYYKILYNYKGDSGQPLEYEPLPARQATRYQDIDKVLAAAKSLNLNCPHMIFRAILVEETPVDLHLR